MKRLKYISRFARPLNADELSRLADNAAIKNKELGITGILMASGGIFFQVIEGPRENIDSLFREIIKDSRHEDILLLSSEQSANLKRIFPEWNMKKIDLDAKSEARTETFRIILKNIFQMRQIIDEQAKILERSIWDEFSRTE